MTFEISEMLVSFYPQKYELLPFKWAINFKNTSIGYKMATISQKNALIG